MMRKLFASIGFASVLLSVPAAAAEFTIDRPAKSSVEYSPYINRSFPQRVFWGDTHLHTTYSADAGMVGNFNLGPADAYRFAKGEQVKVVNGSCSPPAILQRKAIIASISLFVSEDSAPNMVTRSLSSGIRSTLPASSF